MNHSSHMTQKETERRSVRRLFYRMILLTLACSLGSVFVQAFLYAATTGQLFLTRPMLVGITVTLVLVLLAQSVAFWSREYFVRKAGKR
jgi:nitrogen fixation-related uncharacterized protein